MNASLAALVRADRRSPLTRPARATPLTLLIAGLALSGCAAMRPVIPLPKGTREAVPMKQLPRDVVPKSYALELQVDPKLPRFTGHAWIEVENQVGPRDVVWLHARGLDVTLAQVVTKAGVTIPGTLHEVHPDGVAALALAAPLPPGPATIELAWSAPYTDDLNGAYRVKDGEAEYVFTQFEPVAARRCFPGFDEPGAKVPVILKLVVPSGEVALSNMPVSTEEVLEDGRRAVTFLPTPPLPAYLVAFAVGPFEVVEAAPVPPNETRKVPLPLRGVATKGKGTKLKYALERVGAIVTTLERWFGRAHPLPKLDVVAVPAFAAGAMENPGLVTFREGLLLFDDGPVAADQAFAFASVTAHELAHQWFGNLVTLAWWDDLWLNEAFATWLSARVLEQWQPGLRAELDLAGDVLGAMEADAQVAARAIRQPINSLDDVHNAFDGITYSKGAGVISMFERWVGTSRFRDAIRTYISTHANRNATTAQFLAALSAEAAQAGRPGDAAAAFQTFLDQPGVPLVDVEIGCEKTADGAAFALVEQSRFLPIGSAGDPRKTWQVPLCLSLSKAGEEGWTEVCALLVKPTERVELPFCPEVVLPNRGARGYYRFVVPEGLRRAFADEKVRAQLSDVERLAIADSAQAAARAGRATFSETLEVLAPLTWDAQVDLAQKPMGTLQWAAEELVDDAGRQAIRQYAAGLLRNGTWPSFARDPNRTERQKLLDVARLRFAVRVLDDPALRERGAALGLAWINSGKFATADVPESDPTFLPVALWAAVQELGAKAFDALDTKLTTTTDGMNRRRVLGALASARGPLADRALALALDPRLRPDEPLSILFGQSSHRTTRENAWKWLQSNWDAVAARLPEEDVPSLAWTTVSLCDATRAAEIEAFLKPRIEPKPGGPRELAQAMEALRLCSAHKSFHAADARARFAK